MLASEYIRNNKKLEVASKAFEQRNKLIAHATASAETSEIADDKSGFIDSALMISTQTPITG